MLDQVNHPEPQSVAIAATSTAILVLDLSRRCDEPKAVCGKIIPAVRGLLDKARNHKVPILYTVSRSARHTDGDGVASGLNRRVGEPIFYPDSFDKLSNGGPLEYLRARGINEIVVCGSSTNNCVLYTVTSASRTHAIDVYVPVDGVNASSEYRQGYALHQMTNLPSVAASRVVLTTTREIEFR